MPDKTFASRIEEDVKQEEQHAHPPTDDMPTILIKKTMRSGQSVRYPGHVVVLGDVNPGAEIIAGGNIVVMGFLRGVAHAGASGNEDVVVAAFRLQPTQLRIAHHITRAPDEEKDTIPDHPELARIKDGVVVIERYEPGETLKKY
ncbi:MAG: septum site-determining protein MinC [Thermoanaerobacteraceae bacterium]|nr:septum site-determining protein MinC [Thermoanaerobacteraceae bacterium]